MKINKEEIIESTETYIKEFFKNDHSGHDHWHSLRVAQIAKRLAEQERADEFITQMAALLHDVDDHKLSPETADTLQNARDHMEKKGLDKKMIERICGIIDEVSFKGEETEAASTLEGKCVQDADRLDAMGAIGIARLFAYGGVNQRRIYDPEIAPRIPKDQSEYVSGGTTSLNHFYEKLFLLKNYMNTDTGRAIAEDREEYMKEYLRRFKEEWRAEEMYAPRKKEIKKIVITGGPCAGKTTGMKKVKEEFSKRGYAVIIVPETATELISGGISPTSCATNVAYQRLQMKLQMEKEHLFWQAAYSLDDQKVLIVYDRGIMDNWAYMDKREIKKIIRLSEETEETLLNRYDAVFHLETLAKLSEDAYNKAKGNNIARTADAKGAIELDDKVINAWKKHKYFRSIANTEDKDGKINDLIKGIAEFLGLPT